MHPNPAFRQTPADQNLTFARQRGFGTLTINGPEGPLASHIPFLMAEDGQSVDLHLVRSNPIVRALATTQPALLAVTGPDGYVSPDWYGIDDQVPTWNYLAVHLRGTLRLLPEGNLRAHLDALSARFESALAPKAPWRADKLPQDVLARFMRMIVPCRLAVADVQGTWKLGQNKPAEARIDAAEALAASDIGSETGALARMMRDATG